MKFDQSRFRAVVFILVSCMMVSSAYAADKKKETKSSDTKFVDSGSFGIFIKGLRVATETFHIQQKNASSVIKSELKQTSGSDPVTQKSELEITSAGELVRYDWSQSSGGSLTVLPNNEFLIEKISVAGSAKPAEQPFLMPNTSAIMDNNFFVHREVLIWRYLAGACKAEGGAMKCQQEPGEFGVLIPQDRSSARVRVELVGNEKINVGGAERDLLHLNLKGESFDWSLWVDAHDQFKLIKVAIPADSTEVVRD